jgi:hypothetical protein
MHAPGYYREQAEHLDTGAVDVRHPDLLPQLRRAVGRVGENAGGEAGRHRPAVHLEIFSPV